jgi:hypothetical protein
MNNCHHGKFIHDVDKELLKFTFSSFKFRARVAQ